MVDLKPITDAIFLDAKSHAERIKEDAALQVKTLKEDAEAEKEQMRRGFEERLSAEIDRLYSSQNAQLRDRERTALLKVKADAVKAAALAAIDKICALPAAEYREFIKGLLKRAELEKDSLVLLNERDKKRLDAKIFAPAKVAEECINTKGGFKVLGKDADFDLTLEALLEENFDKISDEIGRIYEKGEP